MTIDKISWLLKNQDYFEIIESHNPTTILASINLTHKSSQLR
jgi:hypothetical protein